MLHKIKTEEKENKNVHSENEKYTLTINQQLGGNRDNLDKSSFNDSPTPAEQTLPISKSKPSSLSEQETNYKCTLCNYISKTKKKFIIHQRYHALEKLQTSNNIQSFLLYECKICSKIINSELNLSQHLLTIHSIIQIYDCNICNHVFIKRKNLTEHLKNHFDTGKKNN